MRAASLRITNYIAEGSGSVSDTDFASFLDIARRSVFEVANLLILLAREGYLAHAEINGTISELEEQSKMILAFRHRLNS